MTENSETIDVSSIDKETGEETDEFVEVSGFKANIKKREDVDHPLVPEFDNTYIARDMEGGVSDIELVSFAIADDDFCCLITGEAGIGKDACYTALAAEGNIPTVRFSVGSGVTYEQLIGKFVPATGEEREQAIFDRQEAVKGTAKRMESQYGIEFEKAVEKAKFFLPDESSFTFQYGVIPKAVENGWWVVVDELNAMDEDESLALNQLAEAKDDRQLTILETSEIIDPHPLFRFNATQNPETYAGVNELNAAFKSRFYPITFDYLNEDGEKAILSERTDVMNTAGESAVDTLLDIAQNLRNMEQSDTEIMTKISTRDLIKTAKLTETMSMRDACKTILVGIAKETDKQSIRDEIKSRKF